MNTAPMNKAASPVSAMPVDQTARLRQWRDRAAARLGIWVAVLDAALAGQAAWIGAIAFVLCLQTTLVVLHRPWLDEWQALQIAVESPRIADLLYSLHYEGHPPLWYLILRGLGTLFRNQTWALPAAALLLAIPVQLTVLLAAPFSRLERLTIALSEFMLFEFLTISRSLTLGIALMIAVAALWKRSRLVWLLIAALPLCDFLFGVVSVIFVGLRARERRIFWPGVLLWLASGLCAAWSVRPMPDIMSALLPLGFVHDFAAWVARMGTLGLPLQWYGLKPEWNSPPPPVLGAIGLCGFLAVAWIELCHRRDHILAFGGFVALTLVFNIAVYQLSIRHLMIAAALLIVLVWRKADDGAGNATGERSIWWRGWLIVAALCGLTTAAINLIEPFDTTDQAAAWIGRMGLKDKTWVPFPRSAGQGIAALDTMMFERLGQHCSEDFMRWNSRDDRRITSQRALDIRLIRKVAQDGRFYLVSWFDLDDRPGLLRQIGSVAGGYDGQDFYFYSVGDGHPDARPHQQACNGPYVPLRR